MSLPSREPPERFALRRRGAADLISEELRHRILGGELTAGDPLRETELAASFGVARNTIREALRLLSQEGLAVHEVHRGVSVRRFTPTDVEELFGVRQMLECGAARRAGQLTGAEIAGIAGTLAASEEAAEREDWQQVGVHNLAFHRELVGLLGNARLEAFFDGLMNELRLLLSSLNGDVAGPWLARNRELLELLIAGRADEFEATLTQYLATARDEILKRLQ